LLFNEHEGLVVYQIELMPAEVKLAGGLQVVELQPFL
jgi:hypothetical protein